MNQINVDLAAGDDKTVVAYYCDGKLQAAFQGMSLLFSELEGIWRSLGMFLPQRTKNSRLLVSRNKREGVYQGKTRWTFDTYSGMHGWHENDNRHRRGACAGLKHRGYATTKTMS